MKHKTLGQVFTPEWIVKEILDLVRFRGKNLLDKKIIDPSCGDGAFLKEIVSRIIDKCIELGYENKKILDLIQANVFGIEIDKLEYENCLINLNKIVNKKLSIDSKIEWNIINGDTLVSYKQFVNYFDFVVGNPKVDLLFHGAGN